MQPVKNTRPEEIWVAACIENALPGVTAEPHDDGSQPHMHDIDLVLDGNIFGACEVTAAADGDAIELWNVANGDGERWIEPDLVGGWLLALAPWCRAKMLRRRAPALLRRLEQEPADRQAMAELRTLGVSHATQGGTSYPGSIYVTVERDDSLTGGLITDSGDGLVEWFNEWIRGAEQAHNLAKLATAGCPERHLFVLMPGFTSAPFSASYHLIRDDAPPPSTAPDLPEGLTHVWFMSTWTSGAIFHWSPSGWSRFRKVLDGA